MALLKIENLTIVESRRGRWLQYRGEARKLVDDLSLSVDPGKSVALVGERGGGKLPMTFALQRLHPVSEGRILFEGQDIHQMWSSRFRKVRREMPVLFPASFRALNPRQRVSQALRSALSIHRIHCGKRERAERIEQAMEKAGAPLSLRDRRPDDLSALEYQQATLARALILQPRLLVCHDFTRDLDVAAQAEILNRIAGIREADGCALLMMTHDLAIADHMSETVHILSRGRIVESGLRDEIVNNPQHQYTRNLVAASRGQMVVAVKESTP